jgi:hypothetical protein
MTSVSKLHIGDIIIARYGDLAGNKLRVCDISEPIEGLHGRRVRVEFWHVNRWRLPLPKSYFDESEVLSWLD